MTPPVDPAVTRAVQLAAARVEKMYAELVAAHPVLDGTLAIPGMLVGQGLGAFVVNGRTDDQIVADVLLIVAQIRQGLGKLAASQPSNDDVLH